MNAAAVDDAFFLSLQRLFLILILSVSSLSSFYFSLLFRCLPADNFHGCIFQSTPLNELQIACWIIIITNHICFCTLKSVPKLSKFCLSYKLPLWRSTAHSGPTNQRSSGQFLTASTQIDSHFNHSYIETFSFKGCCNFWFL